jgi:hypothetical protein
MHYIYRGPGFEHRSSQLSILRVKFLATRLFEEKKLQTLKIQNKMIGTKNINCLLILELIDIDMYVSKTTNASLHVH